MWGDHPIALLHLIAQDAYHDPAFVIGNRIGLVALRDAINKALKNGSRAQAAKEMFADDGEGYGLYVRCVSSDEMEAIPFGYTEDYAQGNRKWPKWMLECN